MKDKPKLSGTICLIDHICFSPQQNLLVQQNTLPESSKQLSNGLQNIERLLLMQERHRYKTICVLQARCTACLTEQRWEMGIILAHYWLEIDPLNEEALRFLMKMLVGDDQPQEALRQYEWYQWWLSAELAIEPELSTQNLAHQIASEFNLTLQS